MSSRRKKILGSLAPRAGYLYIRLLQATVRRSYRNREVLGRVRDSHGQYVLAFWHSRFVLMPFSYPDRRIIVLHSRHRDSRMLGEIMQRFGLTQAWGSTTEGGAAAMRTLLKQIREGYDVGIAPDGPRGPRRRVQPGVIAVARLSGKPIIPVSYSASPARRLGSWDRTILPYPFGRARYIYGDPIEVPRRADADEQEHLRRKLEAELDRLTDEADREAGIGIEPAREEQDET